MKHTQEEKEIILREMIAFSFVDEQMNPIEFEFILKISTLLGVSEERLQELSAEPLKNTEKFLKKEIDRIVQFHRLVLLMNIDGVQDDKEVQKLREIGLKMGLRPTAIQSVLDEMCNYPNCVILPEKLVKIFKKYQN